LRGGQSVNTARTLGLLGGVPPISRGAAMASRCPEREHCPKDRSTMRTRASRTRNDGCVTDTASEARKSFHEELDELRIDVIRLAALTTEAIAGGTQAFLDADLGAAERVIENDDAIDELTHSIEDRCYLLLARQQPMASDLRTVVTVLRIVHELERSSDLMVN